MNTQTSTGMSEKARVGLKAGVIVVIVLLLLIPAHLIEGVIREREERQKEAITEVSSKWAGQQTFTGPVVVIPYNEILANGAAVKHHAYFLPETLSIDARLKPEVRHRGIFDVILYTSTMTVNGRFAPLTLATLGIDPANALWDEAYVCVELADANGLKDEMVMTFNGTKHVLSPAAINNGVMRDGFAARIKIDPLQPLDFTSVLNVSGSGRLMFTPVGKTTQVKLSSDWPHPSFTGAQLPDHQITEAGFVANWTSKAHRRNFPQAWKDNSYSLQPSSFGTEIFIAVNGYQKTMRSVKYAILCIVLTFAAFFTIETVSKRSVHPLHYGLIGIALMLFYTLLLSFSEYTGFNVAYMIATVATTALISWFVSGLLQTGKFALVMALVLMLIYSYLFTILQVQDYSLIFGSVGLFITLAVVMYFSRKVKW